MKITTKTIITTLSIIAALGGTLAAFSKYEEMDLPRPAMKSELLVVVEENLETKQRILHKK